MEAPQQIKPTDLGDYLEVMSKSVFQSGMSWKVVENKWPSTRDAFHDFEITTVASLTEKDISDLAQDTRVALVGFDSPQTNPQGPNESRGNDPYLVTVFQGLVGDVKTLGARLQDHAAERLFL